MAQGTLQTLDRGIEALLLVARTPGGLKVGDLAERLSLHRAVAYRIVATLSGHGMVRRLDDGRIVLGAAAFQLGAQAADSIRTQVRPILEDLAERTGATAFLSMAEGDECVVVQTAEPRQAMVNIHYRVGTRHPVSRGAAGIAILSARPARPDDTEEILFARAHGYSATRGQLHKGAVGVSSPVRLPGEAFAGMEYSIGVVALETLDQETARQAVLEAARTLSERFV
ncbi:IclR family transcriptional regulator [Antarcticimicrobium luteum]|uniref:Transcriptional regulator n=1 Tax=Antarcticimicrobium luteum TaxID=2547397 RepID=A0A4R5V886_9RHOB|nr:helix-turn-helix domain-containing protein [Antarcticimicrobium luteum]TDK48091.1 transcriptional regulator [Antarcticimicrobium luteum]